MIISKSPADAVQEDLWIPVPHAAVCSFPQGHLSVLTPEKPADPVFSVSIRFEVSQ